MTKLINIKSSMLHLCRIGIIVAISLSLSSCEKIEIDTQPPRIILIQPEDGKAFAVGSDFLVVTVMHDYVALASYKYNVYWFDDPSNVSDNPNDPAFELDQSATITTSDSAPHWEDVSFKIDIPTGIRKGYYNLDIYCYDKSGNFDLASVRLLFHD
jgi:hypothetical protein